MEYFGHILQSINHIFPKEIPQWTLELISENDFQKVLEQCKPTEKVSSNQSSNPEFLDLLAINAVKTNDPSLDTLTYLSTVPDEDIIEVFI